MTVFIPYGWCWLDNFTHVPFCFLWITNHFSVCLITNENRDFLYINLVVVNYLINISKSQGNQTVWKYLTKGRACYAFAPCQNLVCFFKTKFKHIHGLSLLLVGVYDCVGHVHVCGCGHPCAIKARRGCWVSWSITPWRQGFLLSLDLGWKPVNPMILLCTPLQCQHCRSGV